MTTLNYLGAGAINGAMGRENSITSGGVALAALEGATRLNLSGVGGVGLSLGVNAAIDASIPYVDNVVNAGVEMVLEGQGVEHGFESRGYDKSIED